MKLSQGQIISGSKKSECWISNLCGQKGKKGLYKIIFVYRKSENHQKWQPKKITSGYFFSKSHMFLVCACIFTIEFQHWFQLPEAATSAIGLFVMLAINPTMEKMTKPANMLVKEFMQQTMIESLYGRDKTQGSHCHVYINPLSTPHTLSKCMGGDGWEPFCILL